MLRQAGVTEDTLKPLNQLLQIAIQKMEEQLLALEGAPQEGTAATLYQVAYTQTHTHTDTHTHTHTHTHARTHAHTHTHKDL